MKNVLLVQTHDLQALTIDVIKQAIEQDQQLQQLIKVIQRNQWPNPVPEVLIPYHSCATELSVYDGPVLTVSRIVHPSSLVKSALVLAHETHQGVVRAKWYMTCKFYWPNMDLDVERVVRDCAASVINQPLQEDQLLQPLELPPRPWTKLGIDLGPVQGEYVLTVIDYYSSFPEAAVITDISSQTVTAELMKMFARFGYPTEVVTDNGRQFASQAFDTFLKYGGIKQICAAPYCPKSNGKIERFH